MSNLPNNPETNVESLKPFTKFCMTIGVLPSSYLTSLTYEEQLLWFCDFIQNQVIPTVNNNANAVTELQNLYIELKNYVDNYFTNLDVQNEIDNKIDKMVESGQFDDIVSKYIKPYLEQFNIRLNNQNTNIENKFNEQDNKILEQDNKIDNINSKVVSSMSGSPIPVTSIEEMTNTSKTYLNVSDGKWYYYNGTSWIAGGVYQSTEFADNSISIYKTDFIKRGNNLFNPDTVSKGKYVNFTNGQVFNDQYSALSDYIIVKDLDHIIMNNSNQSAFYDNSKSFISGFNSNESDVPENAYYVRVTVTNADTIIKSTILNAGSELLPFENYKYLFNYLNIPLSKVMFDKLLNDYETNFVLPSNNLIDFNKITKGKFIVYTTGYLNDNENFFATDYIYVKNQQYISVNPLSTAQTAFYDENKKYISGDYNSKLINIPQSAVYMRTSAPINMIDKLMVYFGNTENKKYEPFNNYLYKSNNKIIYVGADRDIKTLKAGIEEASKYFNATVYIDDGTYDLIEEFGSDYLESTTSEIGLVLKNKMHLIFDTNAYVKFNYSGSNNQILRNFSPFNAGIYGFTIENLNIECSNCRYCVHDERGGSTDSYINKYINCKMSLDNTNNSVWKNPQNIGAGLGLNGYIIVDGCHFNNWCTWHNNNNVGYLNSCSKVIIKNNYFDTGFIYATDDYKTNFNNPSLFYVYNNCKKGNIVTTPDNTNIIVNITNNLL